MRQASARAACQIAAEDGLLLLVVQHLRVEDEVDAHRPVERKVCAVEHVIGADLGNQVPQAFLAKDHRVDIEIPPEVFARLQLGAVALSAAAAAPRVRSTKVGRQVSAGMSGADLQSRKTIEGSLENQMRQKDGGLQRIADRVAERSLAAEPLVRGRAGACCGCMNNMTPSCSALAQNGSNFRSDSSCPSTLPPIGARGSSAS